MYATRNLFALTGTATSINDVLGELRFKGLKVLPPGEELTESVINEAFGQNRSLAFSMHDYAQSRYIPCEAFVIDVCEYESQESHELAIFTSKSNVAQQFKDITIKLGLDIGDNKSNSSGLTGEPTRNDCAYCRYLAGYPGENERTVYRSPNFFVLPTLGEFCTGYLLIIPNEHVMSNADLGSHVIDEFKEVLSDIEYLLKLTYAQDVLIWENGSGGHGTGKAKDSIVHSHVHIAPSAITSEIIEKHLKLPFEDVTLETLHHHNDHPYLLVRTPDKENWRICDSSRVYIPRQYVRQLLGEEKGLPQGEFWNWRLYPYSNLMFQTRVDISKAIHENWSKLPVRIQERTKAYLI